MQIICKFIKKLKFHIKDNKKILVIIKNIKIMRRRNKKNNKNSDSEVEKEIRHIKNSNKKFRCYLINLK